MQELPLVQLYIYINVIVVVYTHTKEIVGVKRFHRPNRKSSKTPSDPEPSLPPPIIVLLYLLLQQTGLSTAFLYIQIYNKYLMYIKCSFYILYLMYTIFSFGISLRWKDGPLYVP